MVLEKRYAVVVHGSWRLSLGLLGLEIGLDLEPINKHDGLL